MRGKVLEVVRRLEEMPKLGESYDGSGRHGWRNPVRGDTGPILNALVLAEKPKRILEIGTAYGLSGCYLADALPEDGHLDTIEFDPVVADTARHNFKLAELPVTVYAGDAFEVIAQLKASAPYDMVFLDAEKKQYLEYTKLLLNLKLVKAGTLLIADNTTDRAAEAKPFLDFLMRAIPERLELKTECGLYLARL